MGGYEVTADSEQPMMFRVCLSDVETDQWLPPKKSHVGIFDVTRIRSIGDSRIPKQRFYLHAIAVLKRPDTESFMKTQQMKTKKFQNSVFIAIDPPDCFTKGDFSSSFNEVRCQCVEFRVNRVLMVSHKVSAAIVMETCSTSEF
ncbi:unnamed protein product [Larinioides sclopetarius]|uniref:Uncharacterized protein n=1 Tax=Larinioides sclopetarius TaxID=280406 RepID=A0AAV2ATY1_9ARAC